MVNFPHHFNPSEGIFRMIRQHIANMSPDIIEMLMALTTMIGLKSSLVVDGEVTAEHALTGCDALGHMHQFHEVLGLPATMVSINTFSCGCLFGVMGKDEFLNQSCNEHIKRFTGTDVVNDTTREQAGHELIQQWINTFAGHIRHYHSSDITEEMQKMDGSKYDWSAVYNPEQKHHDDVARDLLNE